MPEPRDEVSDFAVHDCFQAEYGHANRAHGDV